MKDAPIAAGHSSFGLSDPERVQDELGVGEGSRFLDLACGRGEYSLLASHRIGERGIVYAVDLWQEGVSQLDREMAVRGIRNIRSMVADASVKMPIETGGVDICLAAAVLHDLVEDGTHEGVLDELQRVLAKGAAVGILEFRKVEPPPGPPLAVRLSPSQVDALAASRGLAKVGQVDIGDCMYLSKYRKIS